ncbi:MAG: GAF domain-containing protein [Proteobacteria bacterium]|nr:GAF domain-containing protein [Pseudomonadota bacterium]MBU1687014.1 GAF domain-containing protein [Pseudomonadota bacterium]
MTNPLPENGLAVADLEMANRLLDAISRVSQLISKERLRYPDRLRGVLEIILEYLGAEQGSIMILEKKDLVVQAASRKKLIGLRQPLNDLCCVASWVASTGTPLFLPDISKDHRFRGRGHGTYKKHSLLSVPIINGNRTFGVINVTDKAGPRDLFKEDIHYLLEFSGLLMWLMTREKLLNDLNKQRRALKKKNLELEQKQKIMEELSSMLIHDLKGPLSEVIANLDILSYSIDETQREFLDAAQLGCERTVRMVSNLVSVHKMEDGRIRLLIEEADPANLLMEAVTGIKGLARNKEVDITLDIPPNSPPIRVDRVLILRVLQNLLTNALHFSPASSSITTSIGLLEEGRIIEFSISDQGPGIPVAKQQIIFDKYARIAGGSDTLIGSGLGLYFCKLVINEHKGRIRVDSRPESGSTFAFQLPV